MWIGFCVYLKRDTLDCSCELCLGSCDAFLSGSVCYWLADYRFVDYVL